MASKFLVSKFTNELTYSFVSDIDFSISGLFVVEVPDGVQLETPTDYTNLKSQKEAGFVSLFPDFTNIIYNELDNDSAVDTNETYKAHTGNHEWLIPATNGSVITTGITLSDAPYQYVPFWSVYEVQWEIGEANVLVATYVERDPSDLVFEVSLDDGSTWETVSYATVMTASVTDTTLRFRIQNTGPDDLYLGYYALIWR